MVFALLQGMGLLAATLLSFRLGVDHTGSEASARAMAFVTLITGNVALILMNRSWRRSALATLADRNRAAWVVVVGATATLAAALAVPFLRQVFRFEAVGAHDLALAAAAGAASLAWVEMAKWLAPGLLPADPGGPGAAAGQAG